MLGPSNEDNHNTISSAAVRFVSNTTEISTFLINPSGNKTNYTATIIYVKNKSKRNRIT